MKLLMRRKLILWLFLGLIPVSLPAQLSIRNYEDRFLSNHDESRMEKSNSWLTYIWRTSDGDEILINLRMIDPGFNLMNEREYLSSVIYDHDRFWIGEMLITQELYESVTGENPSPVRGDDYPIVGVLWEEAMSFCDSLNEAFDRILPEGVKFTLPTEEQWEYACEAGMSVSSPNRFDFRERDVNDPVRSVASSPPNSIGIFDMDGSVKEWCYDLGAPIDQGRNAKLIASDWALPSRNRIILDEHDIVGFRLALSYIP